MEQKIRNMNTVVLAYMGDSVYEVYIRKRVVATGVPHADKLNAMAVPFVRAGGQAAAVKAMMKGFLTDEEAALVKRARNHKTSSKPRNADPVEYKWATAFEALVGALYLDGKEERLLEVMEEAARVIENIRVKNKSDGAVK